MYTLKTEGKTGLTASKGILVRCPRMVRDLYPPFLLDRIVVQVHVRSLVKAVVRGSRRGRTEEIVCICEAIHSQKQLVLHQMNGNTHSVRRDTSPCCGGMMMGT